MTVFDPRLTKETGGHDSGWIDPWLLMPRCAVREPDYQAKRESSILNADTPPETTIFEARGHSSVGKVSRHRGGCELCPLAYLN